MRPVDPRLLRESRSARGFLGAAAVLAALQTAATIAQAALLAKVICDAFQRGRGASSLVPALAALGGLAVARGAIAWLLESGGRLAADRVVRELRGRLLARLVRARPGGLGALSAGEVATAATEGARALDAYFALFLPQLLLASIAPPAILVWVAFHDLASAIVMAVTLPLIPVFGILIGKAAEARTLARWHALSQMSAHFLDVVRGLTTLRAFRRGRAQVDSVAAVTDAYRRETMGTLRIAFLSAFVLELAATLGTAVIAVEIGVRLVDGGIALQPALAVLILAPELYGPLRQVAAQFHASADGLTAAQRLFQLLDLAPAVAEPAEPVPLPAGGTIRLESVSAGYPGRGTVLTDVTLELRPGERVAIVGSSGAGKSTLAALLLRFLDPAGGRLLVGETDVRDVDPAAWRRRVAWLPQRPRLEPGPVAEAIRSGTGGDDGAVEAAARAADAADLLGRQVGEGGAGLSAGQLRRVALARALLRDAPLLLLDEPTAHLDEESAAVVARAVASLPRDRTVVLLTHDPALAAAADRVLVLDGGRLRAPERSAA